VGRSEPIGDGESDLDGGAPRQRRALQTLAESFSLEELRDEKDDLRLFPEVVNVQDVRMREGRDRASFPFEPGERVRIAGKVIGQDLDGDFAAQPCVPGAIDLPHAARAQRREDFVRPETEAGGKCHGVPTGF
jgi:hypothetical protein